MKLSLTLIFFVLTFTSFGQNEEKCACSKKDRGEIRKYFSEFERQNKLIADCEAENKTPQRIIISGGCEWGGNGCPVSLVKPEFPKVDKQLKIYGTLKVEIIVDEGGKVIYSKMIKGKKIFKNSAERAACKSLFKPFTYCGKVYKQKMIIRFNFISL